MKNEKKKCILFKGVELNEDFSPEVLKWLEFYNSLSPEQQLTVSYEPKELMLARKKGLKMGEDLSVVIDNKQVDDYDEHGHLKFDLEHWTNYVRYANCYAYAMNVQCEEAEADFYPGVVSGGAAIAAGTNIATAQVQLTANLLTDATSGELGKVIVINQCLFTDVPGDNQYRIAFVLAPDINNNLDDFHFYREDSDGKWSHKHGYSILVRKDAADNDIDANNPPHGCNRNYGNIDYSVFVGYFMVTHS